jgi:hypothetical protein
MRGAPPPVEALCPDNGPAFLDFGLLRKWHCGTSLAAKLQQIPLFSIASPRHGRACPGHDVDVRDTSAFTRVFDAL